MHDLLIATHKSPFVTSNGNARVLWSKATGQNKYYYSNTLYQNSQLQAALDKYVLVDTIVHQTEVVRKFITCDRFNQMAATLVANDIPAPAYTDGDWRAATGYSVVQLYMQFHRDRASTGDCSAAAENPSDLIRPHRKARI